KERGGHRWTTSSLEDGRRAQVRRAAGLDDPDPPLVRRKSHEGRPFRGSRRSLSGRSAKTAGKWLVALRSRGNFEGSKKAGSRRGGSAFQKGVGESGHPDQQLLPLSGNEVGLTQRQTA